MTMEEIRAAAKAQMGGKCKACPVCNGMACRDAIPGPGAKGDIAVRNYEAWQNIRVNMDTICESGPVDLSLELFGHKFRYPFFAGPVGAVYLHYGDLLDDLKYNEILVAACKEAGICAFTGDGTNYDVMKGAARCIREAGGVGVPTVKPWNLETLREKFELVRESGAFAAAMDIDAAGLPFLKGLNPPAGSKTVAELREIVGMAGVPFLVKGIMTVKGALKAREAGADGIVVSNHGGRVLAGCPSTAEVLPDIVEALRGSGMTILVDGGLRSGTDIFKALALGADAVLLARPYVTAVYGGGAEGVKVLTEKLAAELEATMTMCGARSIDGITRDMVRLP